jgi:hypothetical protein
VSGAVQFDFSSPNGRNTTGRITEVHPVVLEANEDNPMEQMD